MNGAARGRVGWSGPCMYCRGPGGRACPLRRPWSPRRDASLFGELRVARKVPGRAGLVGVWRSAASDAWPCRARPCTVTSPMPLASYLECRPPKLDTHHGASTPRDYESVSEYQAVDPRSRNTDAELVPLAYTHPGLGVSPSCALDMKHARCTGYKGIASQMISQH